MLAPLNYLFSATLSVVLLFSLAAGTQAATGHQQTVCEQEYVVQANDWLSKLADKFLGDTLAYPLIFEATNQAAWADETFAALTDPNLIEIGQMKKTDSDRREDFENVFDFDDGLQDAFLPIASDS